MSKILLFSSFILCALAFSQADVQVSTKLSVLKNGSSVLRHDGRPNAVLAASLPDDDGTWNWGDNVFRKRQDDDVLLLRDLVIYPTVSTQNQTLKYSASFKNVSSITSVRFVNIGRERAFSNNIEVYPSTPVVRMVDIFFTIPALKDPRVLIEVYGHQ